MEPLVTCDEMMALERQAGEIFHLSGQVLMENAGRAVAQICQDNLPSLGNVVVLCGPGNNGGDGYVVARLLHEFGYRVGVFLFAERSAVSGEALAALDSLEVLGTVSVTTIGNAAFVEICRAAIGAADVVVDALLGTGLRRDVRQPMADVIELVNATAAKVVSVDIASGIHADTGAVLGVAIKADVTVTFACRKRGHVLLPGRQHRGALIVADIAIPTSLLKELSPRARVFDARDSLSLAPERAADAHKGDCGHVVVWAGSSQTPGAAVLALGGALRGGAGRVSWMTDRATLAMSSPRPPEVMLRLLDDITPDSWLEGADAVVLGPGLSQGASTQQILRQLFESICVPVCLDADALNMIASDPELWSSLPASAVLTPHPKEMARLVGCTVHDVKGDPIGVAVDLAEKRQCSVVLKGAVTVVATPGEATTVFDNLCPALATGGTGDVLAGLIGALLGQGLASPRAAQLGVWVHNQAGQIAAQRHGVLGVIASDVVTCIGAVWRDLDGARANDDEK